MSMNKKIGVLTILTLINFGVSLQQISLKCSPNCMSCNAYVCMACYKRPFLDFRVCDPVDPEQKCEIYTNREKKNVCSSCVKGYYLDTETAVCFKPKYFPIFNCMDMILKDGLIICVTCKNGFPDVNLAMQVCMPFPKNGEKLSISEDAKKKFARYSVPSMLKEQDDSKEKISKDSSDIGSKFENCAWGTVSKTLDDEPVYNCFKCKTGYTNNAGSCVESPIEGCLIIDPVNLKRCLVCDSYDGYFSRSNNGKCTKDNTLSINS